MKKIINLTILAIFMISFASATIVIKQQPEGTYNLGDTVNLPVKITTVTDLSEVLTMSLICNGVENEIYKEYFVLSAGEEKQRSPSIPLIKEFIGRSTGLCKIKTSLGEEFELTDEFKISDKIEVTVKTENSEYSPGEIVIIEGYATKENQKPVKGFIRITLGNNDSSSEILDTVNNGYFYVEIPLEEDKKAGEYTANIEIYEKDLKEEKTNSGFGSYKFNVKQIPTNLEIVFENQEVEPGTNLKVKSILHDQTGEKIDTSSIITIKNNKEDILEQSEVKSEEYLEYTIKNNELPAEWQVVAVSSKLNAESTFTIKEKKDVKIELINETLKITNIGNVIYNDSVLVKIGEDNLNLNVTLDLNEFKEFELTAPDGEYQIDIIAEGEETLTQKVLLTGRAVGVKDASDSALKIIKHPLAWIFMILIISFVIFISIKKGYKRRLIEYIKTKKKHKTKQQEHEKKFNKLINFKKTKDKKLLENIKNKAEVSSSIKGNKQNANIVCLNIKNFNDIDISQINETMQKIKELSDNSKSHIYSKEDTLTFILAPIKTRTFKNEEKALDIAKKIEKILNEHNKLFKQKIDFGISINQGPIIAKLEKDNLKFMSMNKLIATSRKIASIAEKEILLGETIKEKMNTELKTEKKEINGIPIYRIKEIKKKKDNTKFLSDFMKRMKEE